MEKKNNTGLLIILFIIILSLAGYLIYDKVLSKDKDKEEKNVPEEQEEQNVDIDNRLAESENKYNSIIEEYRKAMKDDNFEKDTSSETKYPNINYTMMHNYHNYLNGHYEGNMTFKYTYYDINKDGKDEMIIASDTQYRQVNTSINNITEVYTYDGTKADAFIKEGCLGERCNLTIWDNGIMYFYGSSGASIHGLSFYQIDTDGYSRKTVKDYEVEYDENHNVTITDNISKNVTRFTSDDEVISSVKGNAKDIDLSKLDWKEIK